MSDYYIRFRDPVHGFVHVSPKELKLVDSPEFQRLRRIKQLALTYLIYPGAMHTRFEHSLGVVELATRAFNALLNRDREGKIKTSLKSADLSPEDACTLLRLSALMHDIGHLPFSHVGEEILPNGKKHEDVTITIILKSSLRRVIDKEFGTETADRVATLLDKSRTVPPALLLLRKLISDQFDADRMDYLLRDSHHCGVEYGHFDYLRMLETIRVVEGAEGGLELAIDRGGIHILEAMLLARYWMFTQVYLHKTRCIYDRYLREYMASWANGKFTNLLEVIKYDDDSIVESLRKDYKGGENPKMSELARRILDRRHHKVIFETNDHAGGRDVRDNLTLYARLKSHFSNNKFILDKRGGTIHKFYEPREAPIGDDFMVFRSKLNSYSIITNESKLIREMPDNVRVLRIYADAEPKILEEFRRYGSSQWDELTRVRG